MSSEIKVGEQAICDDIRVKVLGINGKKAWVFDEVDEVDDVVALSLLHHLPPEPKARWPGGKTELVLLKDGEVVIQTSHDHWPDAIARLTLDLREIAERQKGGGK